MKIFTTHMIKPSFLKLKEHNKNQKYFTKYISPVFDDFDINLEIKYNELAWRFALYELMTVVKLYREKIGLGGVRLRPSTRVMMTPQKQMKNQQISAEK